MQKNIFIIITTIIWLVIINPRRVLAQTIPPIPTVPPIIPTLTLVPTAGITIEPTPTSIITIEPTPTPINTIIPTPTIIDTTVVPTPSAYLTPPIATPSMEITISPNPTESISPTGANEPTASAGTINDNNPPPESDDGVVEKINQSSKKIINTIGGTIKVPFISLGRTIVGEVYREYKMRPEEKNRWLTVSASLIGLGMWFIDPLFPLTIKKKITKGGEYLGQSGLFKLIDRLI